MIRKPAVAGSFYPGSQKALTRELLRCTTKVENRLPCIGAIAPHAGYLYSGAIAGELFSKIAIPPVVVILAPNHRGPFVPFALSPADKWSTPLGEVEIDKPLAEAIARCDMVSLDAAPHAAEHSAEVQVPFLQFFRPGVRIVPIVIAEHRYDPLEQFGTCLADCCRGTDTLIIASSDMTHFEPAAAARELDHLALAAVLALDPLALHGTVASNHISMCGVAPAVSMLTAAKLLGARHAEIVRYGNSGDVTGDNSSVVGYASVRVF